MESSLDSLKKRDSSSICSTYGRYPLSAARGAGARLYDLDGREYIDLLAGIAVCNLGHCPPELTAVMAEQAGKLVHVSNLFYQEEQISLAEKLLATVQTGHKGGAHRVFFCNSGAEANEAAIKLARRYMRTVRNSPAFEVVTLSGSFHGRTLATLTATGQAKVKDGFDPLPPGFVTVPWNDFAAMERAVGPNTAAVLLEIIQGEGGVRLLPTGYLRDVAALCKDRGILFMVDEVQTGMCRTGRFWAHQHHDLAPDIFTSSKALANGLPMGAMLATEEVAAGFCPGSHATTFGGGAFVSAVAAKVVDIMVERDIPGLAADNGRYALGLFEEVRRAHPDKIVEVRGLGLIIGIELAFPGAEVWKSLLAKGFLLNLTQDRVLRLLPPLNIARQDLAAFAKALDETLSQI